jgi:hypothetical protein
MTHKNGNKKDRSYRSRFGDWLLYVFLPWLPQSDVTLRSMDESKEWKFVVSTLNPNSEQWNLVSEQFVIALMHMLVAALTGYLILRVL